MVSLSRRKILNQGPWRRLVTQQLIYSHWLKLKLKSAIRNCHRIVAILWLCGSTSKLNEDTTKRKLHKNSFLFSVFQFFFFTPFSNSHFFSFFESFTCCIVNFVFLIILNNFFPSYFSLIFTTSRKYVRSSMFSQLNLGKIEWFFDQICWMEMAQWEFLLGNLVLKVF